MAVLGIVLIVLGVTFLLLGLAGAARAVFQQSSHAPDSELRHP